MQLTISLTTTAMMIMSGHTFEFCVKEFFHGNASPLQIHPPVEDDSVSQFME